MNESAKQSSPDVRRGARPLGARSAIAFVITLLLTLWAGRLPDPLPLEMVLALTLWVTLVIFWTLRVAVWLALRGHTQTKSKHTMLRWAFGPALLVIALLLLRYDVPLRLAFDLSTPALDRLVHDAIASNESLPPRWAGLYRIASAQVVIHPKQTPRVDITLSESAHFGFVFYLKDPTPADLHDHFPLTRSWYIARLN